jgi:hypothetical protein
VSFHFNNPRNPNAESRSQKVWSLKDFEICDVLEKELPHTRQKVINLFGTVICPNLKQNPDISARSYIDSSARLVVAKIQGLIGSHQK